MDLLGHHCFPDAFTDLRAFKDQMGHWSKCLETVKIKQTVPALQELRVQQEVPTKKHRVWRLQSTAPGHVHSHHSMGWPVVPPVLPSCPAVTWARETHLH